MLTNAHTLILRKLLGHGPVVDPTESDVYLYNIAPDHLPLSPDFDARETHRFTPASGLLERYPKLRWVKCHLVVDNFCHYGLLNRPSVRLPLEEREGYTYRKGAELVPLLVRYTEEMAVSVDSGTVFYLAHTLTEIAVDYAIYLDDRSVGITLRDARGKILPESKVEYVESLAALYGCAPGMIEGAQDAAARFYGNLHNVDSIFLGGRTKIVLRKLGLPFNEANIEFTEGLILDSAAKVADYMEFIDASVELLSDETAWATETPVESGTA